MVLVALGAQGCSLNGFQEGVERTVGVATAIRGDLTMRGDQGSEILVQPEACRSGDRANFRGVDLLSEGLVVRVVAEPIDGIAVALIDAETGERRGIFRRSDCTVLRGDIQRTGWQINDVADVSGNLEADCRLPSGQQLRGKLVFEHCH